MTDERRAIHIQIIKRDTPEKLLERFLWYVDNYNPLDEDRCDDYELIKAEILERMRKEL